MSTPRRKAAPSPKAVVPKAVVPKAPKRVLRLIKVDIQPHLVIDDGTELVEVHSRVITITAADWRAWAAEAFSPAQLAALLEMVDAQSAANAEETDT